MVMNILKDCQNLEKIIGKKDYNDNRMDILNSISLSAREIKEIFTEFFGYDHGDELKALMDIVESSPIIKIFLDKDTLKLLGYEQFDGVTFIFTKEYRNRKESVKQIPSSKQMVRQNGVFRFHNTPYSGQFIDYYYSCY